MDYIKGRCMREKCKYFHPPAHLQAKIKAAQHQANQAAVAAQAAAAAATVMVSGARPPRTFLRRARGAAGRPAGCRRSPRRRELGKAAIPAAPLPKFCWCFPRFVLVLFPPLLPFFSTISKSLRRRAPPEPPAPTPPRSEPARGCCSSPSPSSSGWAAAWSHREGGSGPPRQGKDGWALPRSAAASNRCPAVTGSTRFCLPRFPSNFLPLNEIVCRPSSLETDEDGALPTGALKKGRGGAGL